MIGNIEVGDVIEKYGRTLGEIKKVVNDIELDAQMKPEKMERIRIDQVTRHWKPAAERKVRGPLKKPRQRDAPVITKVEFRYVVFPKKTKVFADVTVSDQLVLAGFEIKERATGIDVKFPEGVRLVIPREKLLNSWRNAIISKFITTERF